MIYEHLGGGVKRELAAVLAARDEAISAGAVYGPVVRDLFIVECCTAGRGTVTINGKVFPLAAGDGMILFPGDIVLHTTEEPRDGVWCAVAGQAIARYLARAGITHTQPYIPAKRVGAVKGCIERMLKAAHDADAGAYLRRDACAAALFGELLADCPAAGGADRSVEEALAFMETAYDDPGLSVTAIAARVGLTRSYFSVLFAKKTGMPPHTYLNELRVRKALALMSEGNLPVARAAEAVGLAPENCARVVRRHAGKTPREAVGAR